jgi:hypothetical protein
MRRQCARDGLSPNATTSRRSARSLADHRLGETRAARPAKRDSGARREPESARARGTESPRTGHVSPRPIRPLPPVRRTRTCRVSRRAHRRGAVSRNSTDPRDGVVSGAKRTRQAERAARSSCYSNVSRASSTLARYTVMRSLLMLFVHSRCCVVRFSHASLRGSEEEIGGADAVRRSRARCHRCCSD